jgi:aryl-alcohol dehydrogenase-like predicted oxidoreductase
MKPFPTRITLGRTDLQVSPLGISGGYGIDTKSLLRAFDAGVNYWYHGSMRKSGMCEAVKQLVNIGQRKELVLLLQSYSRWPWLMERTFTKGLRELKVDYADILLLGWYNHSPSEAILDKAERMREKGLFRHLAISSHNRSAFLDYAKDSRYGILHIRYNAVHTGAEKDVFPQMDRDGRPGIVAYTATSWGQLLKARKNSSGEMQKLRGRDCYRFVLNNPNFNICMTGPKNAEQMDEALCALKEGTLSAEEEDRIRKTGKEIYGI